MSKSTVTPSPEESSEVVRKEDSLSEGSTTDEETQESRSPTPVLKAGAPTNSFTYKIITKHNVIGELRLSIV